MGCVCGEGGGGVDGRGVCRREDVLLTPSLPLSQKGRLRSEGVKCEGPQNMDPNTLKVQNNAVY